MAIRLALALVLLSSAGCTTARAVGPGYSLSKDTPEVCARHCDSMGMRLAAVVIIANSEGCVCEPREATPGAPRAGAAAAGITPILAAAAAAAAHQQQEEQRRHRDSTSPSPWRPPGPTPTGG